MVLVESQRQGSARNEALTKQQLKRIEDDEWNNIFWMDSRKEPAWVDLKALYTAYEVIKDQQNAAAFCMDVSEDGNIQATKTKIRKLNEDYEKGRANDRDWCWNMLELLQEMDRNLYKLITAQQGHSEEDCCSLM